ncbi:MAG: hypothetical protein J5J06_09005, partial [Phycisphaerae bacterium]|nr:hypothetical protein [Phycisphaerae bacterium]
ELEKLVVSGRLRHGGNPVLRWMAANVAVELDAAGNIKPSKKNAPNAPTGLERLHGPVMSFDLPGTLQAGSLGAGLTAAGPLRDTGPSEILIVAPALWVDRIGGNDRTLQRPQPVAGAAISCGAHAKLVNWVMPSGLSAGQERRLRFKSARRCSGMGLALVIGMRTFSIVGTTERGDETESFSLIGVRCLSTSVCGKCRASLLVQRQGRQNRMRQS